MVYVSPVNKMIIYEILLDLLAKQKNLSPKIAVLILSNGSEHEQKTKFRWKRVVI